MVIWLLSPLRWAYPYLLKWIVCVYWCYWLGAEDIVTNLSLFHGVHLWSCRGEWSYEKIYSFVTLIAICGLLVHLSPLIPRYYHCHRSSHSISPKTQFLQCHRRLTPGGTSIFLPHMYNNSSMCNSDSNLLFSILPQIIKTFDVMRPHHKGSGSMRWSERTAHQNPGWDNMCNGN